MPGPEMESASKREGTGLQEWEIYGNLQRNMIFTFISRFPPYLDFMYIYCAWVHMGIYMYYTKMDHMDR